MPLRPLPRLSGPVAEGSGNRLKGTAHPESGTQPQLPDHGEQAGAGVSIGESAGGVVATADARARKPSDERANPTNSCGRKSTFSRRVPRRPIPLIGDLRRIIIMPSSRRYTTDGQKQY